jgi:hypothetical protein
MGAARADDFQYAVLEVCDLTESSDFVIGRESHWKEVLQTRDHGLNRN